PSRRCPARACRAASPAATHRSWASAERNSSRIDPMIAEPHTQRRPTVRKIIRWLVVPWMLVGVHAAHAQTTNIGIDFLCAADTAKARCRDAISIGQSWHAAFAVRNKGGREIRDWTFDIDLVNHATGDSIAVKHGVAGDTLSVGETRFVNWPMAAFDEKGDWSVFVRVQAENETPGSGGNNVSEWRFRVENPVSDIGMSYVCVSDSTNIPCLGELAPGQPFRLEFQVLNKGGKPIDDWSYDITRVDSAGRVPLKVQEPGPPIPVTGVLTLHWD